MKRNVMSLEGLRDRVDCFGNFNPDDIICLKWCQLSIRCAILRNRDEQFDIIEGLVSLGMEPPSIQ